MAKRKVKQVTYDFENDGVDHINILAKKGKTLLGRRLSHFAHSQFIHPYYGAFQSMEGFWHFASTGFQHDFLRNEVGFDAKIKARELKLKGNKEHWYEEFTEDIMVANYLKIIQDQALATMMIESELPFTHYYLMQDRANPAKLVMITPREARWMCEGFEKIRAALKEGSTPEFFEKAQIRYATNIANGRPAHQSNRTKK